MLRRDDPPPGVQASALAALAIDHGATGDHEGERRLLMRAFGVAPKYKQEELLHRLAFCHRALKDFRGAVRYMELALTLVADPRDPRRPSALYNLSILQKNDGRLGDALASIDEAMRYNPEMWSLKIVKSGYLVLAGRRKKGLALFERIKDQKPRGQEEFYNIMIAWFHAVSRQREAFYRAFAHALASCKTTGILHWIDQDVDLDHYREESEFKALVAKHRARLLGRPSAPGRRPRRGAAEPDRKPAEAPSVR
ncbi:MAG: tetratricopeptide repeat protein [Planctomycetota bacterium]|jgi:tetratricopeptide (TPR) repeat protein